MTLWIVHHDEGGEKRRLDLDRYPCPTIMAGGVYGDNTSHYYLIDDKRTATRMTNNKPPYRVPSMAEIAAVPWNGYNAISTFSGCGGSSLGYKMAGFRVLWANEFVPAAQEVYRLNHPGTILNTQDIRQISAADVLATIGMQPGDLDLLDGSPPCASFSTAGKREAGWGQVKKYSDTKQRTDDLFFEYARLVNGIQPKVFVAENVSGLVKGAAKGYFLEILIALKECGYNVKAKLLDAQWLGVPQMRQRIIFIGVRKDLGVEAAFPDPLPYRYSVREAIPWINGVEGANGYNGHAFQTADQPAATVQQSRPVVVEAETDISRFAIGKEWKSIRQGGKSSKYYQLQRPALDKPSPALTIVHGVLSSAGVVHPTEVRRFSIAELKRICAFPDDFQLTGTYAQQWERLGRAVPPIMMNHIAAVIRTEVLDRCK